MRPPSIGEVVFAVVSLVVLTDVADAPLAQMLAPAAAAPAIPITRLLLLPTFVGSVLLLAGDRRRACASLRQTWPLVVLVAWAALSALWSAAPAVTLTWSAGLAGTTAFGVVLALRFTPERQLRVLALALALVAAGSLLTPLLPPELRGRLGIRLGAWVGLFFDCNLFGRVMALAALVGALLALASPPSRAAALVGCGVALALLRGSHSLTPQIALAGSAAVAALLCAAQRTSRRAGRRLLVAAAGLAMLAALAVAARPSVPLAAVGKTVSLSGRVEIWRGVADAIRERPLLGYGYGAYWRGAVAGPPGTNSGRHAHNGFLDLAAELGAVGVLLFAVPAAIYVRRAVRQTLGTRSALALWPPAYFTFLLLTNLAESALLRHKIYWALYVAAVVSAACRPYTSQRKLPTAR